MALSSFITSLILLFLLVVVKRSELKRGGRFAPDIRDTLDRYAEGLYIYFVKVFPRQVAKIFQYVIIHITDLFSSALLNAVRFIERKLHRFVHAVRGKKELQQREPTSNYFHDVKNHKEEVSKTIEELEREQGS